MKRKLWIGVAAVAVLGGLALGCGHGRNCAKDGKAAASQPAPEKAP